MPTRNSASERAIGARVRFARIAAKISQGALGERLGISFQQVQKYELGKDRISAARLHEIAGVVEKPIGYFFEDLGAEAAPGTVSLADIVDRRGRERGDMGQDVAIIRLLQQVDGGVKKRIAGLLEAIVAPVQSDAPAPQLQAAE